MTTVTLPIKSQIRNGSSPNYLYILNTMKHDHCDQYHLIEKYIKEAADYQQQNSFVSICGESQDANYILSQINCKIVNVLEEIGNDSLAFDAAFCRLLMLIDYTNRFVFFEYDCGYVAFLIYLIFASCFPSTREMISDDIVHMHDTTDGKQIKQVIDHFKTKYLPYLDRIKCVEFKYHASRSSKVISSVLEQHIMSSIDLQHGDTCIASLICEFAQYPCNEFIYFINNFMSYIPSKYDGSIYSDQWVQTAQYFDKDSNSAKYRPIYGGEHEEELYRLSFPECCLFSRMILYHNFVDHCDERLKFEAHILALNKLNDPSGDDIGLYFRYKWNRNINCYVDPHAFVDLMESVFLNPWQLIKEAMMSPLYPLSIFFNGNGEQKNANDLCINDMWYKKMRKNVEFILYEIIDKHFDKNDEEWMRIVRHQIVGFCHFLDSLSDRVRNSDIFKLIFDYLKNEMLNLQEPPRKKRRLD